MLGNLILDSGPNVCESGDRPWMIAVREHLLVIGEVKGARILF